MTCIDTLSKAKTPGNRLVIETTSSRGGQSSVCESAGEGDSPGASWLEGDMLFSVELDRVGEGQTDALRESVATV
jgi:hypothetical protein